MNSRVVTQLASGISHDLSNALMAVRVYLSVLEAEGGTGTDAARTDGLKGAGQRLQRLVEALQAISAEGTGPLNLSRWWGQVGGVMGKVLPRGVELVGEIDESLPAVRADQGALTRTMLEELHRVGEAMLGKGGSATTGAAKGRVRVLAQRAADGRGVEVRVAPEAGAAVTVAVLALQTVSGVERVPARAVVTVSSDRAAAIVRFMLVSTLAPGSSVLAAAAPDGADVWVVEPGAGRLEAARRWRSAKPEGRLVLVGDPGENERDGWERVGARAVSRADDLEEIREVIGRAAVRPGGAVGGIGGGGSGGVGQ